MGRAVVKEQGWRSTGSSQRQTQAAGSQTESGVKVESSFRVKVQDLEAVGVIQDHGGCRGGL